MVLYFLYMCLIEGKLLSVLRSLQPQLQLQLEMADEERGLVASEKKVAIAAIGQLCSGATASATTSEKCSGATAISGSDSGSGSGRYR